ncbi:MAG: acyl--CoA ligase [Clostridiales bacterium]|nr:acyl--CoA ligase [Clostridiales bacterium]
MDRSWVEHYDEGMPKERACPDCTIYEMLVKSAEVFPKRTAISFEGTHILFSELLYEVDVLAASFSDCNIGVGTVVTICLPNIPQAVIAIYALNKIGAIANMVHPKTPAEELKHCMKQAGSECLMILDAFLPSRREAIESIEPGLVIVCKIGDYLSGIKSAAFYFSKGRKIPKIPRGPLYMYYDNLIRHGDHLRTGVLEDDYDWDSPFDDQKPEKEQTPYVRPIGPDDPAIYLHSGGTTGSPKVAIITSTNMNLPAVLGPQIVQAPDPFANPENFPKLAMVAILPLFHGFGICMCMHCMICNAITMILVPQFKPDELARIIKKEKPQLIAAVPTLYEGMLKSEKLKNMKLDFLRACFSGGDTLPMDLKKRFEEFVHARGANISLREGYGLTETLTVCAVNPAEECRAGSVGLPLPSIDMMITRPGTDEEMPIGEKGEICISGPTVMYGYLHDQEATDKAIHVHADGKRWIHSGDLGHRDEDGFFYFDQRIKRIIKVSGVPVFPTEIERIMMENEDVEIACAVAKSHPYRIHVVKAYVVLKNPDASLEVQQKVEETIRENCKAKLIPYACPVEYVFRRELPRTKIGKVDFCALQEETDRQEKEEGAVDA